MYLKERINQVSCSPTYLEFDDDIEYVKGEDFVSVENIINIIDEIKNDFNSIIKELINNGIPVPEELWQVIEKWFK